MNQIKMYASSLRHKILILCCSYNDIEAVIQAIKLWVSNWYILHPIDPKKDLPAGYTLVESTFLLRNTKIFSSRWTVIPLPVWYIRRVRYAIPMRLSCFPGWVAIMQISIRWNKYLRRNCWYRPDIGDSVCIFQRASPLWYLLTICTSAHLSLPLSPRLCFLLMESEIFLFFSNYLTNG